MTFTKTIPVGLLILAAGCTFDAENKRRSWHAATMSRSRDEGRLAPPTQGVDVNGRLVNLADHAGKVVLLSFWHSQCPPCRALFAHEKQLVVKHSSSLFSLIGINADPDPTRLRATIEKAQLNYPSIADGPNGPVCATWRVDGFPTLVLIDAAGKIRWRTVGAPDPSELDNRISQLIEEIQVVTR
ncbi:MAG: TlpA family protein disulfide reductase [Planctomycetia bacterium]|nr:TlpA family protein disulfide reductase [Planctomycetia bacterium]